MAELFSVQDFIDAVQRVGPVTMDARHLTVLAGCARLEEHDRCLQACEYVAARYHECERTRENIEAECGAEACCAAIRALGVPNG